MTTAHCSRVTGGGGTTGVVVAGVKTIVRTSWRTVPSGSAAVSVSVFEPATNVTGTLTTTDRGAPLSLWRCTSAPLSVMTTRATPLLELAVPVTISAGSLTAVWSEGFRKVTARGSGRSAGGAVAVATRLYSSWRSLASKAKQPGRRRPRPRSGPIGDVAVDARHSTMGRPGWRYRGK